MAGMLIEKQTTKLEKKIESEVDLA